MAYDVYAESLRLIIEGMPETLPPRMSRRKRFAPLSVDVAGNAAATQFVRRGISGRPILNTWQFELRDGKWQMLGGGGGGSS